VSINPDKQIGGFITHQYSRLKNSRMTYLWETKMSSMHHMVMIKVKFGKLIGRCRLGW
jgi:hypothetical protein